jgi:NfeD-like C-terminal, partner-binding
VGIKCRTTTPLSPQGYVLAGSELWRAHSIHGDVNAEVEVVTVDVKGLTLIVKPSPVIASGKEHNQSSLTILNLKRLFSFVTSFELIFPVQAPRNRPADRSTQKATMRPETAPS